MEAAAEVVDESAVNQSENGEPAVAEVAAEGAPE
jgi:hypothetical protein